MGDNIVNESIDMIRDSLSAAFSFFHRGEVVPGKENMAHTPNVLAVFESLQFIIHTEAGTGARHLSDVLQTLLRDEAVLPTLVQFVAQPLLYVNEDVPSNNVQTTFVNLRIAALRTIEKMVGLASSANADELSYLIQFLADMQLLDALVAALSATSTFESFRLAIAETLYTFASTRSGMNAIIKANVHRAILALMSLEPSASVRNFFMSILREVASDQPRLLTDLQSLATIIKVVHMDESADARVLGAEIAMVLSQALADGAGTSDPFLEPPLNTAVADAIRDRLEREQSTAVLTTVLKMFDLFLRRAAETESGVTLFEFLVRSKVERMLIAFLHRKDFTDELAISSARCLRLLIQLAPPRLFLGGQLLSYFNTLSGLLKADLDAANRSGISREPDFRTELGLATALLLVQSPAYRDKIQSEVLSYPMWSSTLKNAIVSFLNAAPMAIFEDMDILDHTGTMLNDIRNVPWVDEKPDRTGVKMLFMRQEDRYRAGAANLNVQTTRSAPLQSQVDLQRRGQLSYTLLVYATHLTFGDQESLGHMSTARGSTTSGKSGALITVGDDADVSIPMKMKTVSYAERQLIKSGKIPVKSRAKREAEARAARDQKISALDALLGIPAQERVAIARAYDKFDSALKLALQFAHHYKGPDDLEGTGKKSLMRSWTVQDVQDTDLFYFNIPLESLSTGAAEMVLDKGYKHLNVIKKAQVTCPSTNRTRQHLLNDLMHNVMPNVNEALETLVALLRQYGNSYVRFPSFLFREKELHLGQRALHSGNMVELVDQIDYYFRQNPEAILGGRGYTDDHIKKLENRIQNLAEMEITGEEELSEENSTVNNDSDGHGGLTSDSEDDFMFV